MTRKIAFVVFALVAGALALMAWAQDQSTVSLPQDKGADKLDVSSYPADMQKDYKLFADKCGKCHTLARPLNTSMTKEDWSRYVKRMMHKPNSGINDTTGKQIFDFLAYDQANRKDKNPKAFHPALSDEELLKLGSGK